MPEPLLQFLPGDNFTRVLQQHEQDLKRLLLEFDPDARFAQLTGPGVEFKEPEADHSLVASRIDWGVRHATSHVWSSKKSTIVLRAAQSTILFTPAPSTPVFN